MSSLVQKGKRKISDEDDKPLCQYGSECYRKNPDHRKKFRHSDEMDSPSRDVDKDPIILENKDTTTCKNETEKKSEAKEISDKDEIKEVVSDKDEIKEVVSDKDEIKEVVSDKDEKEISSKEQREISDISKIYKIKLGQSVGEILRSMPRDFFDFWEFCCSINNKKPTQALAELGFHLAGVYDLLERNIDSDEVVNIHCHCRYYYDPPEFQTVIKRDGSNLYHIGYFRDDPNEFPTAVASNSAKIGPELTLLGDNLFSAIYFEVEDAVKKCKKWKFMKWNTIKFKIKEFASKKNYSLDFQTAKTKNRSKKVVSPTFHGLGIVVPVVNNIGYRPLPDSDETVKNILKKIVSAENKDKRLQEEERLDELMTNIQFANDECDYGMGLELGIDLFCFGDVYFHPHILHLLPLAYNFLKRSKYGEIIKQHLENRCKSNHLVCPEILSYHDTLKKLYLKGKKKKKLQFWDYELSKIARYQKSNRDKSFY